MPLIWQDQAAGSSVYQMEQGLVICPGGRKFPFRQASGDRSAAGGADVGQCWGNPGAKGSGSGGTGSGHPWGGGEL